MIRSGGAEEVQLIEDLLDVARFATGKFKFNIAAVDVHKAVEKAMLGCHDSLREKRIDLETNLAATSTGIKGDALRLQQVFPRMPTKRNQARIYRKVPPFLRELRGRAGLTQRQLADTIGQSQWWVARSETGSRRLDAAEFIEFCLGCGAKPADAIDELARRKA